MLIVKKNQVESKFSLNETVWFFFSEIDFFLYSFWLLAILLRYLSTKSSSVYLFRIILFSIHI